MEIISSAAGALINTLLFVNLKIHLRDKILPYYMCTAMLLKSTFIDFSINYFILYRQKAAMAEA